MRKSFAIVLVLAVAALSVVPPLVAQGKQFQLQGLKGGSVGASDLGKGVYIAIVFASWSPRGRDVVQRANQINEKWGDQAKVIMVDFQEDKGEVEAFLSGQSPTVPVYLDRDGSFSKRYSVTHLPGLLILQDGKAVFSGRLTRDSNAVISQTLG
jgi:thiol-disulfide isomerase/thioredoxin